MRKRGKILLAVAATLLFLALALSALVALAPRWINLEAVRARIEAYASGALGGEIRFERIELSIFPRPSVVVRQLSLSLPGKARGTVRTVRFYPAILSLHRGGLRLAKVRVEEPDFTVEAPQGKMEDKPPTLPELRKKIASLVQSLSSDAPGLALEVDRGRLTLSRMGKIFSSFRDLDVRATFPPRKLAIEARCASNLWEDLSVKGSLDPETLDTGGEIFANGLDLAALGEILPAGAVIRLAGGAGKFEASFSSEGLRTLHANIRGSSPSLSLRRGSRILALEGLRIDGAISLEEGKADVRIPRLTVDSPSLRAEGALSTDNTVPRVGVTVRGGDLDVTRMRERLLAFAGDIDLLPEILDYIRGGRLPSFSFAAEGKTFGDLGVFDRMSIHGRLLEGKVHIKDVGLDLEEARGEVAIERGVLSVTHAAARIGKSRASEGTVRVGLGTGDSTLRVDAHLRADLAELPGLLSRVVGSETLDRELSLVEDLSGSATGQIRIGDRTDSLKTKVTVSEIRLAARYRRVPFPVGIRNANVFYDGERFGASDLSGNVGNTVLSGVSARIRLGDSPRLEESSGRIDADLGELYPWLVSSDVTGEAMFPALTSYEGPKVARESLRELRGSANVALVRLSGPIARPREWEYEATGTVKDLHADTPLLPGPVDAESGDFRIDRDTIGLSSLQVRTMDASLRVTGTLDGYRRGIRKFQATVDGEAGPEAVRWAWDNASLPAGFLPAAPIGLRDARFGWDNTGVLSVAGTFVVRNGPVLAMDLSRDRDEIDVRDLTIRDGDSGASMAFKRHRDELGIRFNGRLSATTMDDLFAAHRNRRGRVEGDFRAHVPLARPEQTTAEGKIEAWDLHFPTPAGALAVDRLDMAAEKNRLTVNSSSLALDAQRFSATGDAVMTGEGVVLDMDVAVDGISWDNVVIIAKGMKPDRGTAPEATKREGKTSEGESAGSDPGKGASGRGALLPFPVTGTVRLSAGFFRYGEYDWKPVRVDIRKDKGSIDVTVRESDLCGVSTRGDFTVPDHNAVALNLLVASSGPDISAPLSCLGSEHARLTGSYNFQARVTGQGEGPELPRAIRGTLKLESENGHIGKADVLARVLAVLSVTEVFTGKVPDLFSRKMPYNRISLEGDISDGKVAIREGILTSPSITIGFTGDVNYMDETVDLVVLAHPLTTVDRIIGVIPGVRYILGGHLISVAAKVTGKAGDPKVSILPAKEVGQGVMGILERTLKLPVEVFTPRTP